MVRRKKQIRLRLERLELRCVLSSVTFVEQPHITGHDAVGLVHAADLDTDGDMDILAASEERLVWYENSDGQGTMRPAVVIHDSPLHSRGFGTAILSEDIDGDGDSDVLWSYFDEIWWFENRDGNGDFGNRQAISKDRGLLLSIATSDIDGDGDLDVAATFIDANKIVWFENTDGHGSFNQAHPVANNLEYAHTVFPADLDRDGDTDLVISNSKGNSVVWFRNLDGNGTFQVAQTISSISNPAAIQAADLDADGDADIVVASHQNLRKGKLLWLENGDGSGNFGPPKQVADSAGPISLRDVDNDDDIDVILGSGKTGQTVTWHENTDGAATFAEHVVYSGSHFVRSIDVADVNSDGTLDILSSSKDEGTVAWYSNADGLGEFTQQRKLATRSGTVQSIVAADLDGDGDDDVVSASSLDREVAWYENLERGTFRIEDVIFEDEHGEESVFVVDLDGDGDNDVLSASSDRESIIWYQNLDGAGAFQPSGTLPAGEPEVVAAGDLDGDGDVDVLSASSEDDEILWFSNEDGRGTFGAANVIASNRTTMDIQVSDLDHDGDLDVVAIAKSSLFWFANNDGHFGERQMISTDIRYGVDVHVADIDNDGDLDVISGAEGSRGHNRGIAWYANTDGRGDFGAQQRISDIGEFVFSADFDSDGDLDLISAGARSAHFHENTDSTGTFAPPMLITDRLLSAGDIFGSDLDADGDVDVLVADRHRNRISWYANRIVGDSNDDGRFDSTDLILVFAAAEYEDDIDGNSTFEEGDWNGDGDFSSGDLVFAFQANRYQHAAVPRLQGSESIFADRDKLSLVVAHTTMDDLGLKSSESGGLILSIGTRLVR